MKKLTTVECMGILVKNTEIHEGRSLTTAEIVEVCAGFAEAVISGDMPCEREALGDNLSMN